MKQDSEKWFDRACHVMPGGVNSPVRAFGSVGGRPVYVTAGNGALLKTAEGRELTDYCASWGPLILGHAHPRVVAAVCAAAKHGTSFGINTPLEVEFAELLCARIPHADQVRLVNSGTEAVMTALRLARGITGRDKLVKFEGGYHGHTDPLLVSAGSGLLTRGVVSSAGVPAATAGDVFVLPYNDASAAEALFARHGQTIAAVIVEPVAGNMGLVPGRKAFLRTLRELTAKHGALLVFDEVISGFRLGPTTYSAMCRITPDLTCLGKIIGGGMPIGAVAGPTRLMEHLAPCGSVYQAGTLSGNPVALAAGLATLRTLIEENPYARIGELAGQLADALNDDMHRRGIPAHCAQLGSMFTLFFRERPVHDLADAKECDTAMHAAFFRHMLKAGIYLPPSQFEVSFVSAAHTAGDIEAFLCAAGTFPGLPACNTSP